MNPNASYVNVNPQNPLERWSTFENYLPVIAMFYLAATDIKTPAIDGHTLDSRLNHFIDEIAHIARAHNWDRKRQKTDEQSNLCFDKFNRAILEEYDDLEGDKPSCFSGVKRRLFQSVLGHPLLKILTANDISYEINNFVRQSFVTKLTPCKQSQVKKDYDKYVQELGDIPSSYTEFNLTEKEQKQFKDYLAYKYGEQFSGVTEFAKLVDNSFVLLPGQSHIGNFDNATQFRAQLLETPVEQLKQDLVPINYAAAEISSQAKELISVIRQICGNQGYWQDKVRNPFKTLPDGVKAINALIVKKGDMPEACLDAIQKYCQAHHSKHWQTAQRLFRGRQGITNELYGLLAQIDCHNINQSVVTIQGHLNDKFAEALVRQTPDSGNQLV